MYSTSLASLFSLAIIIASVQAAKGKQGSAKAFLCISGLMFIYVITGYYCGSLASEGPTTLFRFVSSAFLFVATASAISFLAYPTILYAQGENSPRHLLAVIILAILGAALLLGLIKGLNNPWIIYDVKLSLALLGTSILIGAFIWIGIGQMHPKNTNTL